jgi:hypothetical protein
MRVPLHQRALVLLGYGLVGFVSIGAFFDAISNAIALVSPRVTYALFPTVLAFWVALEVLLKSRGLNWVTSNGQTIVLRRLGARPRAAIVATLILLWLPRLTDVKSEPQAELIPFQSDVLGIVIARFSNDLDNTVQSDIEETLVRRFADLGFSENVSIRKTPLTFNVEDGFKQSRVLAESMNAWSFGELEVSNSSIHA